MVQIDQYHPLVLRRVPVRYSPEEVAQVMTLIGANDDSLASKWRISPRTVRRMRDLGADGAKAAALNAELRLHMYAPILYQNAMDEALG